MRRLLTALLIFIVVNGIYIARQRRHVQQLREAIGVGRGRGPRAPHEHYEAIDVVDQLTKQRGRSFEKATRFSRQQFFDLVYELLPDIVANREVRPHVPEPSGEIRSTKLTVPNRLLLAMKFLVCGSSGDDLSTQFGVSPSTVSEDIRHVVYAIAAGLAYEIDMPSPEQQQRLSALLGPEFERTFSFGSVDGTFTRSFSQTGDFSGHRHSFVRSHQIATDALGYIVHVVAGQIGARHDAYNYQKSNLRELLRACGATMLADAGYEGCGDELVTPSAANRILDADQRALFLELHTSRRSRVEQYIGVLKALFRVVGNRWQRHDRQFLSVCVFAACALYNRWKRLR